MASVIAGWGGRCGDPDARVALSAQLVNLGQVVHATLTRPKTVKVFGDRIGGKILIAEHVFLTQPRHPRLFAVEEGLYCWSGSDVRLEGVELTLPSFQYTDTRLSFVFVRDSDPEIDGLIVQVEDKKECQWYESKIVQEADYFLVQPQVHLRYFLEDWLDKVMEWVKNFYIPDLRYWRWGDVWTDAAGLAAGYASRTPDEWRSVIEAEFLEDVAHWRGLADAASERDPRE